MSDETPVFAPAPPKVVSEERLFCHLTIATLSDGRFQPSIHFARGDASHACQRYPSAATKSGAMEFGMNRLIERLEVERKRRVI